MLGWEAGKEPPTQSSSLSLAYTFTNAKIMDTPRPEQVRQRQPEATEATEADVLELMEMILGALGRDAVGLGSRWEGGMDDPRRPGAGRSRPGIKVGGREDERLPGWVWACAPPHSRRSLLTPGVLPP